METLQRGVRGLNTPTSLFSLLSLLVHILLTVPNWKQEDKRACRCYSYRIIQYTPCPYHRADWEWIWKGQGKIGCILPDLCFSESFMGSISSPSSLCAGNVFNHSLFSLEVFFFSDLTLSHFLTTTETLFLLSEISVLSLAGLAFRFSWKTKTKIKR